MSCSSHSGSWSRRRRKRRVGAAGRASGEAPTQRPPSPTQRAQLQHSPESMAEDPKASWPGRENGRTKSLKGRDKFSLGEAGWKRQRRGMWAQGDTPCAPGPWPCLSLYHVPLSVSLCLLNYWTQGLGHSPGASAWTNRAQRASAAGRVVVSSPDPQAWGVVPG